jgi:hypothetical protein
VKSYSERKMAKFGTFRWKYCSLYVVLNIQDEEQTLFACGGGRSFEKVY